VILLPVSIEKDAPKRLSEANLKPRGKVKHSPVSWRDQVLYFLLPDRFSDGKESNRPVFDRSDPQRFKAEKSGWMKSGKVFQRGTIKGITSKLDYVKRLGSTTLWIGPIWQQRADSETYHGYAIQNFLDVDPRFGTRQDLRDLVDAAHDKGLYVLLDIIYNHSGNNWFYTDSSGQFHETMPYRFAPPYSFGGWRNENGKQTDNIVTVNDGVWPIEFQNPDWHTRAGQIEHWDPAPWENPLHDDCEFRRGDFFSLKDLDHAKNEVLSALIRVYQYWIALCDCDGLRIDTVKHTSFEGSRNFCGAIREYAESIGKENFLLLGEVTGGARMISDYLEIFGRNIDAALDIGAPADRLADMVKGFGRPEDFFKQFGGQDQFGSHRVIGRYHVSILDDHDKVGSRNGKFRFSAQNQSSAKYQQVAHAVGVQLTTLGIPCLYYGTEQAFDGSEKQHDADIEPLDSSGVPFSDRYIRECMFGGKFGAFQTKGCHFFDENHPTYLRIAAITRVRKQKNKVGLALRRGRQYLLKNSENVDKPFSIPLPGELVAWSRIFFSQDVVIVLNTNGAFEKNALVALDSRFHPEASELRFLYRGDWTDAQLKNPIPRGAAPVEYVNGFATIHVSLPPAGMAILA
jgi:glycosidase